MASSNELQLWVGRSCLAVAGALCMAGWHFANIRFVPIALGFAIFAALFYGYVRVRAEPSRPLAQPARPLTDSDRHRAL